MIIGFVLILLTSGGPKVVDDNIYELSECEQYKSVMQEQHLQLDFDCVAVMRERNQ